MCMFGSSLGLLISWLVRISNCNLQHVTTGATHFHPSSGRLPLVKCLLVKMVSRSKKRRGFDAIVPHTATMDGTIYTNRLSASTCKLILSFWHFFSPFDFSFVYYLFTTNLPLCTFIYHSKWLIVFAAKKFDLFNTNQRACVNKPNGKFFWWYLSCIVFVSVNMPKYSLKMKPSFGFWWWWSINRKVMPSMIHFHSLPTITFLLKIIFMFGQWLLRYILVNHWPSHMPTHQLRW